MLRVGLVGYGFMGGMHSQCYAATGEAKIVAVADVEPDKRELAREKLGCDVYASLDEMLNSAELDIIDICTPTYLHQEHVVKAASAGKDIMCEKPMALTLEACDAMIEAVNKAGIKMMVGQVIRFWPEYQAIKGLVDSGEYGKVEWVSARRLSPPATWAWQNWIADPQRSGGAIHDLHIHDLDYIAYLIGSPKKIASRGIVGNGGGFDSALTLGWEHESGASSYAEGSLNLAPEYPFTMSILVCCEKASIKYDSGASPSLIVYPLNGEPIVPQLPSQTVADSRESGGNISSLGGYYNEIKYFVDCVKGGRKPEIVTPESAREAVRLCLAARSSAESGQIVEL